MSYGVASHAHMKIAAADIAANNGTDWTKISGNLPDCLALIILNDLDQLVQVKFNLTGQGTTAPTSATTPDYEFAAGEPAFLNYKNIGQMFGLCDVYVRKGASDPTTGSLRITGVKVAPARLKGVGT